LVEHGQLSLDEDVNKYLESWQVPENEFTRKRKVTLRLLLTHQAGLPAGGFDYEEGTIPSIAQVLMGQSPAQNQAAVVEFIPGTRSQYSNLGYVVIQLLIEDLLGRPLTRAAHEILFEPLEMRSSTLEYPLKPELAAREAMPHDAEGETHEPAMHPTAVAQGGLVTTPCDLALFAMELMHAYRGLSHRLLSPEMVRRMFHPQLDLDPAMFFFPTKGGLGALLRARGQHFSFLHPGANSPGATCWLEGCPTPGKGAVIMTNGAMGLILSLELLSAIAEEYGWPDAE
jgi:CubicO group peptidase (beta-lactamase class C family)